MAYFLGKIKSTQLYGELRFIYLAAVRHHRPWRYLVNRFYFGPKIKKLRVSDWQLNNTDTYSFHTLCGRQHVYMLAWSLASWLYQTKELPAIYLHSDGSLAENDKILLKRIFPRLEVIDPEVVKEKIVSALNDYPHIQDYRKNYKQHPIYLPKLIDPYFVSQTPFQLFFDVDVLFFSRPDEILKNIQSSTVFMTSGNLDMFATVGLAGFRFSDDTIPENTSGFLNGGIVGYPRASFNLEALDYYFKRCGRTNNYRLIEQAGYAYVLSRNPNFHSLNMLNYHIKGPVSASTVSKHYTGPRREEFWLEGIKILKRRILY